MNFGERMRLLRTTKGLTQDEIAKRVGIKQPCVAQYERGSKQPTIPTAKAIAEALGVSIEELIK